MIIDSDLARLYGVATKALNRAVKRNRGRFPADFVFRIGPRDVSALKCQSGTSNRPSGRGRGGRRYVPYAFTEHGAVMAANVLNSTRAVRMSVLVVRAFVRLRLLASSHAELAHRLGLLERKYDAQFKIVFDAIRALMEPPPPSPRRRIGFQTKDQRAGARLLPTASGSFTSSRAASVGARS